MISELTLFDRIALANNAVARAQENWGDESRFLGEYETARLWTQRRVQFGVNLNGGFHNYRLE
jgi:hypothetical protein